MKNAISVTFLKGKFKGVAAIANPGFFEVWSMDVGDADGQDFIFGACGNMYAFARSRRIPDPSEYTGRSA
jgi:hypothetical protein